MNGVAVALLLGARVYVCTRMCFDARRSILHPTTDILRSMRSILEVRFSWFLIFFLVFHCSPLMPLIFFCTGGPDLGAGMAQGQKKKG